jgi:hypothetical protein
MGFFIHELNYHYYFFTLFIASQFIPTVLKKNGPPYDFAIDDSNEKKLYRKRSGSKNTTNLSEHTYRVSQN